ncbi:hypothetical protein OMP38_27945 [Cohnella ginsengisoli]|uniref:Uncharacterized protein n=1 Tax=Cohnella ginsengisoli TaxID=425004 RepID=A0A9X4QQ58_9BACL|nr:hypothetical protein [Cohnella ginsengisoli]MDG0794242.1 hypothetical protein [Cohnella ginsengisoli]
MSFPISLDFLTWDREYAASASPHSKTARVSGADSHKAKPI